MGTSLVEIMERTDEIEKFLKELIEVNLQLIEEVEPEVWEKQAIRERRDDEFLE